MRSDRTGLLILGSGPVTVYIGWVLGIMDGPTATLVLLTTLNLGIMAAIVELRNISRDDDGGDS